MMVPEGVIWIVSLCSLGSIIVVVLGCVCGCRKKAPKNELMGLAGMVKLTYPDENIDAGPDIPSVQVNDVAITAAGLALEALETNKRQSIAGIATATRSLPDLPVQQPSSGDSLWGNNDPNDTGSDLYATVEENKNDVRSGAQNKKHSSELAVNYSSPSQTEDSLSPYARLKGEHPYDQLKQKNEHPYAQVRANGVPPGLKSDSECDNSHLSTLSSSSSSSQNSIKDTSDNPVAPPRTRKSLNASQNSLHDLDSNMIPAATAIAGGIPANQELPYMTPPLNTNGPDPNSTEPSSVVLQNQPQHFSGDSQDSSKGYTSISVREPLSKIRAECSTTRRQELIDSHYTTVSDDSDEMYAAIEEPNQSIYNSGSETYAQIRPSRAVLATIEDSEHSSSNHINSLRNEHSRQASSSSAGSSGVCPNSPKPEKRQANSPLPRPPDPSTSNNLATSAGIDDMYAKVLKKRRSSHSVSSVDNETEEPVSLLYEPLNNNTDESTHDSLIPGYERVSRVIDHFEPNYEELKPQDNVSFNVEACYSTVNKNNHPVNPLQPEPDYASLSRKECNSGYDPNYESVCPGSSSEPNYESLEQQEPPYEKLQSTTYETSPDYETVYKIDSELYSKVNKQSTTNL